MFGLLFLVYSTAGLLSLGQAKLACDDGYEGSFNLKGNYCYKFVTEPRLFDTAEYFCNEDDASSLASIHDAEENQYIAARCDGCFIGMHNVSGVIQWTDASPVDYANYDANIFNQPIECIKIVNGIWQNANCDTKQSGYVCKRKAVDIPETPKDQCPSADAIYSNYGTIYSPGYPDYYVSDAPLRCTYKLKGQEGYKVTIEAEEAHMDFETDYFKIYEGWTQDESNLLLTVTNNEGEGVSTKESNMMLVVFYGANPGFWKLMFYTEPAHPTTRDPSIPTTAPVYTSNCPANNVFADSTTITSPGFPFTYDTYTNCMYIFNRPGDTSFAWDFEVIQQSIGSDDYIDFIDLRSNTIFASTRFNIQEGVELMAEFPVGIHFQSGGVAEQFGHWRIEVHYL